MAALSMLIIMREIQHGCDQGMYFFYLSFLHSFFSLEVKVFMITFGKVSFHFIKTVYDNVAVLYSNCVPGRYL